jgi:hypothetical protein
MAGAMGKVVAVTSGKGARSSSNCEGRVGRGSHTRKVHRRDRTGWLGRSDSIFGVRGVDLSLWKRLGFGFA